MRKGTDSHIRRSNPKRRKGHTCPPLRYRKLYNTPKLLFGASKADGILVAIGQVSGGYLDGAIVTGELSLDGSVRPINGALPIAIGAREHNVRRLFLPAANGREAAIVAESMSTRYTPWRRLCGR